MCSWCLDFIERTNWANVDLFHLHQENQIYFFYDGARHSFFYFIFRAIKRSTWIDTRNMTWFLVSTNYTELCLAVVFRAVFIYSRWLFFVLCSCQLKCKSYALIRQVPRQYTLFIKLFFFKLIRFAFLPCVIHFIRIKSVRFCL